jgi:hypothetical protein
MRINAKLILLHLEPESAVPHISLVFREMGNPHLYTSDSAALSIPYNGS